MPKLPQISGRDLSKILKKSGWQFVGQRGSHMKFVKDFGKEGKSIIIVPNHKIIKKGTLSSIVKITGISF